MPPWIRVAVSGVRISRAMLPASASETGVGVKLAASATSSAACWRASDRASQHRIVIAAMANVARAARQPSGILR